MTKNLIRVLYFSETGTGTPVVKKQPKEVSLPTETKESNHATLEAEKNMIRFENKLGTITTLDGLKSLRAEGNKAWEDKILTAIQSNSLNSKIDDKAKTLKN
jgi:hypothetical protein